MWRRGVRGGGMGLEFRGGGFRWGASRWEEREDRPERERREDKGDRKEREDRKEHRKEDQNSFTRYRLRKGAKTTHHDKICLTSFVLPVPGSAQKRASTRLI